MPDLNLNFFSLVLLGRQNPQILTHDFLINNDILPKDEEPFKSYLSKEKPYSEFISTPVLTSIKYGHISIVVEENRYQIRDSKFSNLATSPVVGITRKYFGEHLRYTPCNLCGVNFNSVLSFEDKSDEERFDEGCGLSGEQVRAITDADDIRAGVTYSFPWKEGMVEIQIAKPKNRAQPGNLNFNYEFEYKNIDSFVGSLDEIERVYEKFEKIVSGLGLEVNK